MAENTWRDTINESQIRIARIADNLCKYAKSARVFGLYDFADSLSHDREDLFIAIKAIDEAVKNKVNGDLKQARDTARETFEKFVKPHIT